MSTDPVKKDSVEKDGASIYVVLPPQLYTNIIRVLATLPYGQVAPLLDEAKVKAQFAKVHVSDVITDPKELKEINHG